MTTLHGVRRFDLGGSITSIERTPQGFLKVPGFATRTGVFTYMDGDGKVRRELRHPDDVFDPVSLATLRNAVVTLDHPPELVTPENFKTYSKGYTTDRVEVNRDLVETDLIIAADDAIAAVEKEGIRELSCGYVSDLDEEPGVYNGTPYDFKQTNIKYNHVALVKRGRAGPEARLRLDSADAVMQEAAAVPAAIFSPEGENDMEVNEENKTKSIVISGQKVELPAHAADVIQALLDRYDDMRGQVAQIQEEHTMKKDEVQKKDVDVSQKGVSPQPAVEQMAPDGRASSKKVDDENPFAKKKEDEEEEEKKKKDKKDAEEKEDGEEEEKKKDKKDAEGDDPVGKMKKDAEEMKGKLDAMQAKLDEYAAQSSSKMSGEMPGKKMDSADVRSQIKLRVRLERQAEKLVPSSVSTKFDSMSDDEIRSSVIKHRHPKADLSGKSSVYLQTRFDSITETMEEGETVRKEMGSSLLNTRMDKFESADPMNARRAMIDKSRSLYTEKLSASKK